MSLVALALALLLAPAADQRARWSAADAATMAATTAGPPPAGTLGYAQVEGFWIAAGGPPNLAASAAAIATAESSLEPGIIETGVPFARTGWGLWQITPGDSAPTVFGSDYQILDPWNNAEAAVWKYQQQGLAAWTTYSDGLYKAYLQNVAPDLTVTDPGEYVQINPAPKDTPTTVAADPGSRYGPPLPTVSNTTVSNTTAARTAWDTAVTSTLPPWPKTPGPGWPTNSPTAPTPPRRGGCVPT